MERDENIYPQDNKNRKVFKVLTAVIVSLILLVIGFGGGYMTREAVLNEELRTLDWILSRIKKNYYEDFSSEELIDAASDGLMGLLDKYSAYYTKEEYELVLKEAQGIKAGLGIIFLLTDSGVGVYRTLGNSPAERAGFQRGEMFKGLRKSGEGEYTAVTGYEQLTLELEKFGKDEAIDFLMLQNGTEVVRTAAKEEYEQNYVKYKTSQEISSLDEKSAYLGFEGFSGKAYQQFVGAMNKFKAEGKTKLVLDLRDNGGGYMDILEKIAAHLLKNDDSRDLTVVNVKYKDGKVEKYETDGGFYAGYGFEKITVLINGNTASASEALLGAMLDYGSLTIDDVYGTVSYGKGIMQTTYRNPVYNDAITLTTARIYWPLSDTCIHGVGITPETVVDYNYDNIPYDYLADRQLAAAIAGLNS